MATGSGAVVGREEELAALLEFLGAPERLPGVLVLEGEAGIGKTTLWRAGLDAARERGYRVLVARPSGAEAQLSFSALRDLLGDAFDELGPALPVPQRIALAVALLRAEPQSEAAGAGAVAAGFLTSLWQLAGAGPLVVAVDDAQWLDAASAAVVEFAVRRLESVPVALLVTRRGGVDEPLPLGLGRAFGPERLRRLSVGPISIGALQSLLRERLGTPLPRPLLRRVHETAAGNPFYALELARALEGASRHVEPGEPLPVPQTILELLGARIASLPSSVRGVLAVASALADPTPAAVAAGSDRGERAGADLEAAAEAGVVRVDEAGRIRFAHPLLAAAAYATASEPSRRRLHRRLAEVAVDVEQRAQHLALSASAPNAEVARALDEGAAAASRRGATPAAAELAEKAHALTPADDPGAGRRRALAAAEYRFEAGETERARALFEQVATSAPPGRDRAWALSRLARMTVFVAGPSQAADLFQQALAEAGEDSAVRARAEEGLSWALILLREDVAAAFSHASAAASLAEELGDSALAAEALTARGVAEFLLGGGSPQALFAPALVLERWTEGLGLLRHPRIHLASLLMWADDLDGARTEFEQLRRLALDRGDESALPMLFSRLAYVEWLAGRWALASAHADEAIEAARRVGHETQRAIALAARALVGAHLGQVEPARAAADECLELTGRTGAMGATAARGALGFLELSLGNAAEAAGHLLALVRHTAPAGIGEPSEIRFLPDAVEALLTLGRLVEAEELVARLEEQARKPESPSSLAAADRCRGLVLAVSGRLDESLAAFESALARHEQVPLPFERARTLLALGSTLRRAKQKRAARERLGEALTAFEGLGAALWSEKTRSELSRIGGRAPASGELTPTERRVAALVAEGRLTKQVAAELFISAKTVEGHLSSIYAKLGVHSRTELAHRFTAAGDR